MPEVAPDRGAVAVTGASGFIGAHVVAALLTRGYDVRACVTDVSDRAKTEFLTALAAGRPGSMTLHHGNLLQPASYDDAFSGCCAVMHVGTPMGYGGRRTPQEVYDGTIAGTRNVLNTIRRTGSVRRLVYTSSFLAIFHPAPAGYVFTEQDWASDNREEDTDWNLTDLASKGDVGYAMAKVESERMINAAATECSMRFDAVSICPSAVLGPLLSPLHELVGSWQWHLGRMLAGRRCMRSWDSLWNCVDVRDVGEAEVLALESGRCVNGSRYQLTATDRSYELTVSELQERLRVLFPQIDVGGPPDEYDVMVAAHGGPFDGPRALCDKARLELGLETHDILDTLRATGETMLDLGLVEPRLRA